MTVLAILCCCAMAAYAGTDPDVPKLDIAVLDQSHLTVPAALVEIKLQDQVIASMSTDETGHAVFPAPKPGRYTVSASKEGFETAIIRDFEWWAPREAWS